MISFQLASERHLPAIIRLLADDELGSKRESYSDPLLPSYVEAFRKISDDPGEELIVALDDEKVVGCMQLSILPSLTYKGRNRAQIEGVRIDKEYRGRGMGKKLILEAIDRARKKEVVMIQLTSTASRKKAIKFYEDLGFNYTHAGMKLMLQDI